MTKLEEIENRLEEIEDGCHEIWEQYMNKATEGIPFNEAWEWYNNQPLIRERIKLNRELRILKEPNYEPIPKYGDHMKLETFIEGCKNGPLFTNSDGEGYYATEDQMTDILILPSDIISGKYRKDFSHIVWFNK